MEPTAQTLLNEALLVYNAAKITPLELYDLKNGMEELLYEYFKKVGQERS